MSILTKKYLGLVFFWSVAVTNIFAIIGADNPDGPAGTFEGSGMSTTAGSINTYTANASRSVTDLVVAGGVGSYPLAFSRISNSRYLVGVDDTGNGLAADFGSSGNWLHSYQ